MRWLEANYVSKNVIKFKAILEGKTLQVVKKAMKVVIFLGGLSCIVAVAAIFFGLRFHAHEFIHSEISMFHVMPTFC